MTLVSEFFKIGKTQGELDFVNVPIDADIPLFIDPFAISQRIDPLSRSCHMTLVDFFSRIIDAIRVDQIPIVRELLSHLQEPNETRFGYSKDHPRGAGIGEDQSEEIYIALRTSSAVKTGFISALEECELMVEGIGRDKISDLTTNVIRLHLAEYTKQQCDLWGIPTQPLPLPPAYDIISHQWVSQYFALPLASGSPLLFVPKAIARFDPSYEHKRYYRRFVLAYLQAEHLDANSSLVRTLKNHRRVVYKKDIEATFPCTKEHLFEFSRDHPAVLQKYREDLQSIEKKGAQSLLDPEDEIVIANALSEALSSVSPGSDAASAYHSLMIGILEFIFFPSLLNPLKERVIHEGRKRIDIVMENGARSGIFHRLHDIRKLPCAFVAIECKNYHADPANPELDQLAGRFAPHRGKLGLLCCRHIRDKETFIKRCRDTFREERGAIIPIDDGVVKEWLGLIAARQRNLVDVQFAKIVDQVWFA